MPDEEITEYDRKQNQVIMSLLEQPTVYLEQWKEEMMAHTEKIRPTAAGQDLQERLTNDDSCWITDETYRFIAERIRGRYDDKGTRQIDQFASLELVLERIAATLLSIKACRSYEKDAYQGFFRSPELYNLLQENDNKETYAKKITVAEGYLELLQNATVDFINHLHKLKGWNLKAEETPVGARSKLIGEEHLKLLNFSPREIQQIKELNEIAGNLKIGFGSTKSSATRMLKRFRSQEDLDKKPIRIVFKKK